MRPERPERPVRIVGLATAREFFARCFAGGDPTRETLWVAHVDSAGNCVELSCFEGDATGAAFPLRSIVLNAIQHNSAGVIVAHNHPSGDARPSDSDCKATRRLVLVAEALDLAVLDHLIFAGAECTSLRQLGLL